MSAGPTEVLIANTTYEVQYVSHEQLPEQAGETVGWCDEAKAVLLISDEVSDATIRATFWHECLHAIVNEYGRGRQDALRWYLDRAKHRPAEIEEQFVGYYETGVLCFVRDNPEAWSWITGEMEEWAE